MADGRVDGEMIEIGDPSEDPTSPEPPARVVIEYRERGIPWMLIPPLLVISALGAILLHRKLSPPALPPRPPAIASTTTPAVMPPASTVGVEPTPGPTLPDAPTPPPADPGPMSPAAPSPEPAPPVVVAVEPEKAVEPAPPPRFQAFGLDPKALEADRKPEAPPDPALAPANQEPRADNPDQPREVDPDLLPPDPRLGRVRQQQRVVEALKKAEEDRVRFHADLKAVCREFRSESGPEILDLIKTYETKLEPSAKKRAAQLLGEHGRYLGADRTTRLNLLRSLGYPEPVILDEDFLNFEKRMVGERDGPRNFGEAYYRSALFLLRNPPARPAALNRAAQPPGPTGPAR